MTTSVPVTNLMGAPNTEAKAKLLSRCQKAIGQLPVGFRLAIAKIGAADILEILYDGEGFKRLPFSVGADYAKVGITPLKKIGGTEDKTQAELRESISHAVSQAQQVLHSKAVKSSVTKT